LVLRLEHLHHRAVAHVVADAGALELFPNQNSAILNSALWADGLIDNAPGQAIRRGDTVRFLPYSELLG
jgi:molybdopterin molybdotransferase